MPSSIAAIAVQRPSPESETRPEKSSSSGDSSSAAAVRYGMQALRSVAERRSVGLVQGVSDAVARGAKVLSVRSGAFVLAEAGVLGGNRATTNGRYTDLFAQRYP